LNVISEKNDHSDVIGDCTKNLMTIFGEVTGYEFFLVEQNIQKIVISEKMIPKILLVKKQSLECYW